LYPSGLRMHLRLTKTQYNGIQELIKQGMERYEALAAYDTPVPDTNESITKPENI
jgi:hypothetical protein